MNENLRKQDLLAVLYKNVKRKIHYYKGNVYRGLVYNPRHLKQRTMNLGSLS